MEKDYRDVIRRVFESRDDQNFIERWVGRATEAPDFLARCRDCRDGVITKSDAELQEILDTVDIAFMERNPRFQGLGIRLSPEQWGKSRNAFLREEASDCQLALRRFVKRYAEKKSMRWGSSSRLRIGFSGSGPHRTTAKWRTCWKTEERLLQKA